MKKSQLKRKLAIATEALKLYKDYMIDGKKYAEEALEDMRRVDNDYVHLVYYNDEFRIEIRNNIRDILERELKYCL